MVERGIMSAETAQNLSGVTNPRVLIQIMELFDMLIPCQLTKRTKHEELVYLVPCLMKKATADQVEQRDKHVPPIHFMFTTLRDAQADRPDTEGFLPRGLFHRLISSCCRMKKWLRHRDLVFNDYMVFDAGDFCFSLRMVHNGISLSAFKLRGDPVKHSWALCQLREEIEQHLQQILHQVFPSLSLRVFLPCTCSQSSANDRERTK